VKKKGRSIHGWKADAWPVELDRVFVGRGIVTVGGS